MQFQTPPKICDYMVSLLQGEDCILEPTPGDGFLVKSLINAGNTVCFSPHGDFFKHDFTTAKYNAVVMNPPFTPMKIGYDILFKCMDMAPVVIALMPWLTIINSEKRTKRLVDYGLKSITHLPRNVFPGSRVQTCILNLRKDWRRDTKFINYTDEIKNTSILPL